MGHGFMLRFRSAATRAAVTVALAAVALAGASFPSQAVQSRAVQSRAGASTAHGSIAAVSSPGISAPPDLVVGEADSVVNLLVTLSAPGINTVSVNYQTAVGTAAGWEPGLGPTCPSYAYDSASGTLTFPPGVTSQVVTVNLNNCGISNPTGFQSFFLELTSASGGALLTDTTEIDITGNNVTGATPALSVRNAETDSRAGSVSVPVLLGGPSGVASTSRVTVDYATHNGSARAGTDYTATSGTLTFPPGQTAQNITVPITARSGRAPARSFSVTLSSPTNATVATGTGTVMIGASGGPAVSSPGISAPPDVVAGEADGYLDLPITLSAPSTASVTVSYQTQNGTASGWEPGLGPICPAYAYGDDSDTVTFPPGVTTEVVRLDLYNCQNSEPTGLQSFYLQLSSPSGGTLVTYFTEIDITGNNITGATPALYARNAETDSTAGTVSVPVLLGGPSGVASTSRVTVDYATHNGSARAGTDYTATSGTLTFPPGQTAQNITVPITARSGRAPARLFTVTLSSPTNAAIAHGTGVVTIGASGGPAVSSPDISVPADVVAGEADGYLDLPITLSAPSTRTVFVAYQTQNGTAAGWEPGLGPICPAYAYSSSGDTLTFPSGVTTEVARIDIYNCQKSDPGYFTFELSSPVGGTITNDAANVEIIDNPGPPRVVAGVSAIAGDHAAVVRFSAPYSDDGEPIYRYTVTASPGGATASGAQSPITVTGLHNGTRYTFRVTATNVLGTGPASAKSPPVTVGVPAPPTKVTAARVSAGKLKVTFAPGANNGSPITGYLASCTSANGGKAAAKSGRASPLTVTGLTARKRYTCTVTARNASGSSPASAPSRSATA